jgi:hypothetical protein
MVEATPNLPTIVPSTSTSGIKVATPDLIITTEEVVPVEVMTDLLFEDIGAEEIINIARNDIVAGQLVSYQPIKNLTSIYLQYNPQNVLSLQNTANTFFKNFPIKFENKVPDVGTGPNGEIVYIDSETGDIIINVINLEEDEQVEVQMLNAGDLLNDTIYEVNN